MFLFFLFFLNKVFLPIMSAGCGTFLLLSSTLSSEYHALLHVYKQNIQLTFLFTLHGNTGSNAHLPLYPIKATIGQMSFSLPEQSLCRQELQLQNYYIGKKIEVFLFKIKSSLSGLMETLRPSEIIFASVFEFSTSNFSPQ